MNWLGSNLPPGMMGGRPRLASGLGGADGRWLAAFWAAGPVGGLKGFVPDDGIEACCGPGEGPARGPVGMAGVLGDWAAVDDDGGAGIWRGPDWDHAPRPGRPPKPARLEGGT